MFGINEILKNAFYKKPLTKEERIKILRSKGIDPKVEMKDSGVEWIGSIPESWKIYRISISTIQHSGERGEGRKASRF